jgi:hypothetical protein
MTCKHEVGIATCNGVTWHNTTCYLAAAIICRWCGKPCPGGPRETAMRFASEAEAQALMRCHDWVLFHGGMAVRV